MLLTVGDLVEDVVVWPQAPVQHGTDTPARVERRAGGSAANVARFVAALGASARFVGCVGDDAIGRALADGLAAHSVDVRVQRRGRTGTIVVVVDADGERTMLPDRGACTELADVPDTWLDGVEWLHVPAYSLMGEPLATTTRSMIVRCRRAGARLSVDASSVGALGAFGLDAFAMWLADVRPDVLFANRDEADALALARRPRAAACTVVKQGADPVLVWSDIDAAAPVEVAVPAFVAVRDTTGAGDAFAAGFVTAAMRGAAVIACADAGIALAQRVLANAGASL